MLRTALALWATLALAVNGQAIPAKTDGPARIGIAWPFTAREVRADLDAALAKHDVPALGAAVVTPTGLQAEAVAGVRKRGSDAAVTAADRFHLGSDTKAMTATLCAILVEQKLLAWDLTMEKAFPEIAATMTPEFKPVTLDQLLRHRGGLPANLDRWKKQSADVPLPKLREQAAHATLTGKAEAKPGSKFIYSNVGYVIAGCLAERATKASWEDLMRKHLFDPLGMKSSGFGPVATKGPILQPYPHTKSGKPVEPGPGDDNPPLLGPAGTVHCSLADWSKFVADQLRGAQGKDGLLPAAAYRKLHTPATGEDYTAGGWLVVKTAKGTALAHDGDNTMNHSAALLLPDRGLAVLVVCNQGMPPGRKATSQVQQALVERLGKDVGREK